MVEGGINDDVISRGIDLTLLTVVRKITAQDPSLKTRLMQELNWAYESPNQGDVTEWIRGTKFRQEEFQQPVKAYSHVLQLQRRIKELDAFCMDPQSLFRNAQPDGGAAGTESEPSVQLEAEKAANLRLLAFLLSQNPDVMLDDDLKPGDSIVSFSFGGIKALNDNLIGADNTRAIIDFSHDVIQVELRKAGLVGLEAIPMQEIWKRISIKVNSANGDIKERLLAVEAQVKQAVAAFIRNPGNLSQDLTSEQREEAIKKFGIYSGYASEQQITIKPAQASSRSYDLLHRSVVQTQIKELVAEVAELRKELESLKKLPAFEDLEYQLTRLPENEEERVAFLYNIGAKIRYSIALQMGLNSDEGFSDEILRAVRKNDLSAFLSHKKADVMNEFSAAQQTALFKAARFYTDILAAPVTIKYFSTHDMDEQREISKTVRSLFQQIATKALNPSSVDLNIQETRELLRNAWIAAKYDQRFQDEKGKYFMLNPLLFDVYALNLSDIPNAQYLAADSLGVGVALMQEAQAVHLKLTANNKQTSYEQIMTETRDVGFKAWEIIQKTTQTLTGELMSIPEVMNQIAIDGVLIARLSGDDLHVAFPGADGVSTNTGLLDNLVVRFSKNNPDVQVRLVVAGTIRGQNKPPVKDPPWTAPEVAVWNHVQALRLTNVGIEIAKKFEARGYQKVVVDIRNNAGEVEFRLLTDKEGKAVAKPGWLNVQEFFYQMGFENNRSDETPVGDREVIEQNL